MKFNAVSKTAFLIAALVLAPVFVSAKSLSQQTANWCEAEGHADSYNWNFSSEASQLIETIETQSIQVRDDAQFLESLTREPHVVPWQAHADQLAQVRPEVNRMAEEMCRLEAIRTGTQPWQQQAIDQIEPAVTELVNYTEQAIAITNRQTVANFASPSYTEDVHGMYTTANRIVRAAADYVARAGENATGS
jgi:hypothetical protein